jgi:hypothetical protein
MRTADKRRLLQIRETFETRDTELQLCFERGWDAGYSCRPANPYAYREDREERCAYLLGLEAGRLCRAELGGAR